MTSVRENDKYTELTTRAVKPLIVSLAIPTIISMLSTAFYNIADTYYVGHLSTQAVAAVGIAFSVMAIIQAIGFFFGHGSGNYISRALGAKHIAEAQRMSTTGFFLSVAVGFLITLTGKLCLTRLAVFLGSTPTILPEAQRFLSVILWGAPCMTGALTLNTQMRFQGNASKAMIGITTGVLLNILLAPFFIFVFDMGISGAATATVICQFVSFTLLLWMNNRWCKVRAVSRGCWRYFTPTWTTFREIIHGGLPSLARQGLACIAMMMLNQTAAHYGDEAIAGMSIVTRLMMFIFAVLVGFGQGFQPVCGFNYGARKYDRVLEGFWFCTLYGTGFLLLTSIVGTLFSHQAVALFLRDEPRVIEIGVSALRWQLMTMPLIGFVTISNMMMQTLGLPWRATILSAARQGLFFIPAIYILPRLWGLTGLESAQAVADLITVVIAVPLTWSVVRPLHKGQSPR